MPRQYTTKKSRSFRPRETPPTKLKKSFVWRSDHAQKGVPTSSQVIRFFSRPPISRRDGTLTSHVAPALLVESRENSRMNSGRSSTCTPLRLSRTQLAPSSTTSRLLGKSTEWGPFYSPALKSLGFHTSVFLLLLLKRMKREMSPYTRVRREAHEALSVIQPSLPFFSYIPSSSSV